MAEFKPIREARTDILTELIDFINDPKFNPLNQDKYFFTDGMSYYQQLLELTKLCTEFQKDFLIVYENEEYLKENAVTEEVIALVEAIKLEVEQELARISSEMDTRFASIEELLEGYTTDIAQLKSDVEELKAKEFSFYVVTCRYVNDAWHIYHNDEIQTHAMLLEKFNDNSTFLYLTYDYKVYIPSFNLTRGMMFTAASIYRETDDNLYAQCDRVLITSENVVTLAHIESETTDNKITSFTDYGYGDAPSAYPTADAVIDYVGSMSGVPAGGTTGQSLVKKSNTDGDVEWKTISLPTTIDASTLEGHTASYFAAKSDLDAYSTTEQMNEAIRTAIENIPVYTGEVI